MKSFNTSIVILLILFMSCEKQQTDEAIIKNKLIIFTDSFLNNKNITALKTIATENFVRNINDITVASDLKEAEANSNVFFTAFPDLKIKDSTIYIKNNHAFINWMLNGSNTGIFGEIGPTGKKIKISGISHLYFNDDGKLFQEDIYYNELDLLQQLGYTLNIPIVE